MDSIEGFTKKIQSPSAGLLRNLRSRPAGDWPRETAQRLAARQKDCIDRKIQPALAGPVRTLGTRNAVPGTAYRENSLTRHWLWKHPRDPSTRARLRAALRSGRQVWNTFLARVNSCPDTCLPYGNRQNKD